jgi:glucokinase
VTTPGGAVPGSSAIGVDIGGTHFRAARIGPDGRIVERIGVRTDSASEVPQLVIDLVDRLLDAAIVGIGIGVPGRLDPDGTTIVSSGFVELADVRLGEQVARTVGRPVVLDNDAGV